MDEFQLSKDWPIRPGVIIRAGATVQLQQPFIDQMKKAGIIFKPEELNTNIKTEEHGSSDEAH